MPIAQNSRKLVSYVEETAFGTTPTDPTMVTLPINTFQLVLEKGIIENNEIRPDEMQRFQRHGDRTVSGDMVADLRKTDFDPFLEAVMRSSWATNTLKVGTSPKYFSIEEGSLDIAQYKVYTGVTVNTLGISATAGDNSPIAATFGLMGKDMGNPASSTVADTLAPATSNEPFDHYAGNGFRLADQGGTLAHMCITSFELNIDRGYETRPCIGDNTSNAFVSGMANIEGSFTAYFEDEVLINRFLNETATALEFQAGFDTDIMTFLLPNVRLNSADNGVAGNTGANFVEVSFKALYDTSEESSLVITRPAP